MNGPNYHINYLTDDNAPSMSQYPGLAFANKDNVNCFAPTSEAEYTIHKTMANPHEEQVQVEDSEKVIKASAAPQQTLQKGMGQVSPSVLKAFEHPVMKTSKVTIGAGRGPKKNASRVTKRSKINYV